jgi:beta-lactamase class A
MKLCVGYLCLIEIKYINLKKITLSFFFLIIFSQLRLDAQILALPLSGDGDNLMPLSEAVDPELEMQLMNVINSRPLWKSLVKKKKMAVGLIDISNPDRPKFARANGQHMMYAASLPKIAILLAVIDAVDKGEVEMTPELDDKISRMISVSSNTASTELIDLVGYEKIARILQHPQYRLYDRNGMGGLWVGKRYAAKGRKYPDPIKGLSHAASVTQVCRFYYMLAYGKLINCHRSEQMLEYLKDPKLHHKFVNTLDKVAPNADVYRKSGSWKKYHADSVLVIGDEWRSYILVSLIEHESGESIMRDLILEVESILSHSPVK